MSDSIDSGPRRKVPPRYWVWLGVILLVMFWPAVFLGIGPQVATHLRPGLCVLGMGSLCILSGMQFVGLWTTVTFAAIFLHGPSLLIGAVALVVWFVKVIRYLPSED